MDAVAGIDAEFVALTPPVMEVLSDGTERVSKPSRLALGRVSVVRGEGPLAGTCSSSSKQSLVFICLGMHRGYLLCVFVAATLTGQCCIADYVRAVENVYDHLSRYSWLVPGDLDPAVSRHNITTLKRVYMKLRYLVDCGCIFVGHGLKKDFRILNIVVPPEQIIDTVDLYYLRRQRKLSLRYLCAYLLRIDIQSETHDSIEDSRTALQLYSKYCELKEKGILAEALQEIYRYGRQHNWEVRPERPPLPL